MIACFLGAVSLASAFEYVRKPAGLIKGARLEYVSSSSIKIGVGYGENMGSCWEIGPTDTLNVSGYTLSGLSSSASGIVHYIYIDRASSSFPNIAIRNSTSSPTWSSDFLGWYSGSDRCVAAVWVNSSGSVVSFTCPEDDLYQVNVGVVTSASNSISTTTPVWTSLDCSSRLPVNASSARIMAAVWWTSGVKWDWCQVGFISNGAGGSARENGVSNAAVFDYGTFPRGAAKTIQYLTHAPTNLGTLEVYITAFKIER